MIVMMMLVTHLILMLQFNITNIRTRQNNYSITSFCILLHIAYKLQRILYNVHVHACCIQHNNHRTSLRTTHKVLLLYHFPNSLIVQMHNRVLHIPYKAEYILPSFLYHLPAHRHLHNGYKALHS